MQVNRINSTSFGSGTLVVNPRGKEFWYEDYNPQYLSPEKIKDIKQPGEYVNLRYETEDSQICELTLPKTVSLEKVLAAYTAAMVASEGTFIDITRPHKSYKVKED